MPKLVWLASAEADLQQIIRYVGERDGPAALRLRERFLFVAERLTEFPNLHRIGKVAGTREAVAHPNYIMVYRVGADTVEIVTIYHARRQYP